ncbi:MAG: dihydrolipoyl dehydrogenase [Bacteroidales bacterium]|jgi:dihydrolipoamide dehydrogenase|nr:dihydrolipoyl dehydrogenase [Bacteroidales bacterium]
MIQYDIIVIGSGPGGYVAAIRAAQLGFKTAIVERAELGGICLNWGCIPTKALLKCAEVFRTVKNAAEYGVVIGDKTRVANDDDITPDLAAMVARSRSVAETMSKGVTFLLNKYKVEIIKGEATVEPNKSVSVRNSDGDIKELSAPHIILATGSRPKQLPNIPIDGEYVISYREAMTLQKIPQSLLVMGSGAIGAEFAYFYSALGCKVTLVEYLPRIVPLEDEDVSAALSRAFRKNGIRILTDSSVEVVEKLMCISCVNRPDGYIDASMMPKPVCQVIVKTKKGEEFIEVDKVLSAVGVQPNTDGFENIGIKTERGKVITDEFGRTSLQGYYAIGDITDKGAALAHVASHEALVCVEKIAAENGMANVSDVPNVSDIPTVSKVSDIPNVSDVPTVSNVPDISGVAEIANITGTVGATNPQPLDYTNIPACTYTTPEIASVGLTEQQAREKYSNVKTGKFPYTASGKATAAGAREGFVKVIFDGDTDLMLGCHLVGDHVTEMISEAVLARQNKIKADDIIRAVHPHPTMSEALMEAVSVAYGEAVHL